MDQNEYSDSLRRFVNDSGKIVDYLAEEKIDDVVIMSLSGHVARDAITDICNYKDQDVPTFHILNPHNLAYVVGYYLGVPLAEGEDEGSELGLYMRRVFTIVKDRRFDPAQLLPIKELIDQQFPDFSEKLNRGEKVLLLDEITAAGATLDFMEIILKTLYPGANLKRGGVWKDSAERYAQYDPPLDVCGGEGIDFLEKARMGSIWTGRMDMQLPDEYGDSYTDERAIFSYVQDMEGRVDLSDVKMNPATFGPEVTQFDTHKINEIKSQRKRNKKAVRRIAREIFENK